MVWYTFRDKTPHVYPMTHVHRKGKVGAVFLYHSVSLSSYIWRQLRKNNKIVSPKVMIGNVEFG